MEITREYLLERLSYNPITGRVSWEIPSSNRLKQGDRAGSVGGNGYRIITFKRKPILEHRIIWFMVHGEWPNQIDHINQNKADNRLCNLRSVSAGENSRNKPLATRNTSGFNGVSWIKRPQKWMASIKVDGRAINLGEYEVKEDAIAARKEANIKYGFHKNHGSEQAYLADRLGL